MPSTKSVPGIAARALRAIGAFIAGRLVQLGLLEDEDLNVVMLDGTANTTVSVHTAAAAGYRPGNVRLPPPQRKWWGCVGCRMLSVLVQENHCWNVMNGVPMTAWNYLRACFFISWVLVSPLLVHWWALLVDLLVIAPFAVAETVSRRWS
jgi:hypothetical protein